MKKWELIYHKDLGIGVIISAVHSKSDYIKVNFDNKEINKVKVLKAHCSPIVITNYQKVEQLQLF